MQNETFIRRGGPSRISCAHRLPQAACGTHFHPASSAREAGPLRRRVSLAARAGLVMALAALSLNASAAYRCPQPGGGVSYQDLPCAEVNTAPAAPSPAAAPQNIAPQNTAQEPPAPQAANPLTANPPSPLATPNAPSAAPYMGDPEPDTPGDASDTPLADADTSDAGASEADVPPSARASGFLAVSFLRLGLWLVLAALVGFRATARNRSFVGWAILAMVFSPALIYLILRLMGPANEAA